MNPLDLSEEVEEMRGEKGIELYYNNNLKKKQVCCMVY